MKVLSYWLYSVSNVPHNRTVLVNEYTSTLVILTGTVSKQVYVL